MMSQICFDRQITRNTLMLVAVVAAASLGGPFASADTIYQTNTPFGGPFGLIGFDVFQEQKVALRFTPNADFTLDRVSVWFMNNDGDGGHPPVTVSLRTDNAAAGSIPSDTILEQWQINVSAVGWAPVLEAMDSSTHPLLSAGEHYWVVAESDSGPFINGVWNWAAQDSGMMSICNGDPCEWTPANSGAVAAGVIEGTPLPDCPGDIAGNDNVVNVDDLLAIINAWGPCADPKNCPADIAPIGPPQGNDVVNVDDLLAVINAWGDCP
jgi:hypothetical protein